MDFETITVGHDDGMVQLTLNRPEALNAFNRQMRAEVSAALDAVAADRDCRALLITGAGRAFSAGADLVEPALGAGNEPRGDAVARVMDEEYHPMMRRLHALEIPVVAAVNGAAAGGGMSLALSADIAIAARSAYFVQVFGPRLGIVPDLGSSWLLPHVAGRARALGLALLGDRLPAEAAAEWGLIWQCVDDDRLMDEATALAKRLAKGPTKGFGLIKRAVAAAAVNSLDQQLDLERDCQREAGGTDDFAEGVAAFQEKREPVFKGR